MFRGTLGGTGLLLFLTACSAAGHPPRAAGIKDSMFVVVGDRDSANSSQEFLIIATRRALIDTVRAEMQLNVKNRHHISGPLRRANPGENPPWSWSIPPDGWSVAEFSIELCDGRASMVERDLDYWLNTVKRFCPWHSYIRDTLWVRPRSNPAGPLPVRR
jgi:hypothetical protein